MDGWLDGQMDGWNQVLESTVKCLINLWLDFKEKVGCAFKTDYIGS